MKRIYLYKRIVLVGVCFAMIVISIGACGTNDTFDDSSWIKKYVVETIELEGDALEEYTSQGPELFWINRQFDKEYGSYNEALEQEIIDHERKGDSESLFRVCLVLNTRYRESAYWDRVNQFYSELMERMKSDSVLRKYINEEHRDYIDIYLETLKNKDMRDEYKEFFVSIDDYVIDANDVVMRVIMFLPKVDEVDIDDSRFFRRPARAPPHPPAPGAHRRRNRRPHRGTPPLLLQARHASQHVELAIGRDLRPQPDR